MRRIMQWVLAATLVCGASVFTSCSSDNDDNPVINPDEPQQQLADYTIIYYGHGGGNLDMNLLRNIKQFFQSDTESRKNVSICAQYKYSTLKNIQGFYESHKGMIDPNNPEDVEMLENIKNLYPYAGKTTRFVVVQDADTDEAGEAVITSNFIGPDISTMTTSLSAAGMVDK